jgi:hypothetical protein
MRIPVQPSKVQLQGPYNSQAKRHEPPGTTVYHAAWAGQGTGVIEWGMALDALPQSGDREYVGNRRAPHADEVPNLARCIRIGYLSSGWYAVRDLSMDAPAELWKKNADGSFAECRADCGEAHAHFRMVDGLPETVAPESYQEAMAHAASAPFKMISRLSSPETPPAPRAGRPITGAPRIVSLSDYSHREANSEGCMVVVDDVAAVAEAVKAGKYTGPPGAPDLDYITYPAKLPGRRYLSTVSAGVVGQVPRYENGAARWNLAGFALTAGWGTVFETWEEAQQAISHALEQGVLPQ